MGSKSLRPHWKSLILSHELGNNPCYCVESQIVTQCNTSHRVLHKKDCARGPCQLECMLSLKQKQVNRNRMLQFADHIIVCNKKNYYIHSECETEAVHIYLYVIISVERIFHSLLYKSNVRFNSILRFAHLSSVFDFTAIDERASADGQPSIRLSRCCTGRQGRTNRTVAACGWCESRSLACTHAHTQIITKLLLKQCNIVQESETNWMPESSPIFSSSHGDLIQASLDVQVLLLTYERLFYVLNN